jgi:predicted MFS family arabinose efflux permease
MLSVGIKKLSVLLFFTGRTTITKTGFVLRQPYPTFYKGAFMNITSPKLRNTLIMITLGLTTMATMNDMVIIPVVDNLFADFANVNIGVLNYILSGPALVSALFSLLSGKLMERMSKKTLMAAGFAAFAAGAVLGDAVHNAYYMVVARTLVGAGMGITLPVAMSIVAETFVSEKSRSAMMGLYNSSIGLVGALLSLSSGMVAASGWRMVYRIYLASLPVLVMIFLFLPRDKAVLETTEESLPDNEKMPWRRVLLMNAAFIVFNIVYCIIYYQISVIIAEKGFGDTKLTGVLAALGTLGSILGSATLGLIYPRLKRFTVLIGYGGMAVCFWLLYTASGAPLAIVSCALLGFSYAVGTAYYMMYCTTFVSPGKIPLSISIATTAMAVGQFLSTYCATFLQGIMKTSLTDTIPVLILIAAAGVALSCLISILDRKKSSGQA